MADFHVVLVVDGDVAARNFAARSLREHGILVAQAASADHALELVRHVIIDVLLADLVLLAAGSGAELVHAARRRNPEMRVVCVSGFAPDAGEAALRACERLLVKPYRPEQLRSEIRRLLPA